MTAADQNAERIFAQCEKEAKKYATQGGEEDKIAYLRHLEGLYRGVIRGLYIKLEQFEDGAHHDDFRVPVVFGSARATASFTLDSCDDICMTGVWVNGADIQEGLSDEQLANIDSQIQHQWAAVQMQIRERNADMLIDRVSA